MLTIDRLSIAIHDAPILRDVSIAVGAGEIHAITGESGSGKSMTALAIMGLLPNGAKGRGNITLGDTNLTTLNDDALCKIRGRDIGMVFQEPMTALNPVQTIGAQVAETIRIHDNVGKRAARTRAAEVLTRVGLPPDKFPLSRYPHQLSGGQRQRVVIAMAIALRPKLLIADEPTTALDVTTQAQILDLLLSFVREDGMGMILITHDLAVVANISDRISVMQKGAIVETGPTRDVLQNQTHPYTRKLFTASTHRVSLPLANLGKALLRVQGAVRSYPSARKHPFAPRQEFRAVDDVSFDIHAGERVGLVGESGCGKSTLTRAILGLDPLSSGEITLEGRVIKIGSPDLKSIHRRIQVVFQDPFGSFNPRHQVGRLITEPFHLLDKQPYGYDHGERIAAALRAVGLIPSDAFKYIHEFSGGQRQRIAIARALIIKPDLIIFDEAVSALDVSVRAQILDLIAGLSRDHNLAYLFISHDLSVVREITDRCLVMQSGKIVEEGRTQQIFDAPNHPYSRRLIAATPRFPDFVKAPA